MKIIDNIKDKLFNPEEFYNRIINGKYPLKYYDNGKYLRNLYLVYGEYDKDLVIDSLKYFDKFKKAGFYFPNLDAKILNSFSNITHSSKNILKIYDQIFIQKEYSKLYELFDVFIQGLFIPDNNIPFSEARLAIYFSTYVILDSKMIVHNLYQDRPITSIFNAVFIKYWINNEIEKDHEIEFIVQNILFDTNFKESLVMKGFDPYNLTFKEIDYIANLLCNKEFSIFQTKIIK